MTNVGDDIIAQNASWTFAGKIADNFSEHVRRSVPLYEHGHDLIRRLSDFFIKDGSICYELGCSTGVLTNLLAKHHANKSAKFIGVDVEFDMIRKASDSFSLNNLEYKCADINEMEFETCDLFVTYYTVQFVSPSQRQNLINKIYQNLKWGGGFLMFEKVRACDARFQDICTAVYTDFKLDNGYTPDEIVNKARSLKGILEPFSTQGNIDLMKRAGFVDIMTIMKYIPFEGFIAIK